MYDHDTPLAATRRETCKSPSHGLAKCADASRSVATSSTQHGSGLADSAQSPTGERKNAGYIPTDMEGFRASGSGDQCHTGQPCEEKRVASLGHETRQRRQPIHPQGQEDVVKPQGAVSTENVLRLLEHQQHRCALTGRELTPETAALDHIIPIRCDGEHVIENTQVLHKDVNRAKGSLTNEEFKQMCHEIVDYTARQKIQGGEK